MSHAREGGGMMAINRSKEESKTCALKTEKNTPLSSVSRGSRFAYGFILVFIFITLFSPFFPSLFLVYYPFLFALTLARRNTMALLFCNLCFLRESSLAHPT